MIVANVLLFLVAAKAHGRELRLERQSLGVDRVVFGGVNPPVVEALWRAERARFWPLVAVLALAIVALLWRAGAARGVVVAGALAWAPAIAFSALGVASLVRSSAARGELAGSATWWAAVAVAATVSALVAAR